MKNCIRLTFLIAVFAVSYGVPMGLAQANKKDERNNIERVLGKDLNIKELGGELLITANEEKAMRQLKALLKKYKGQSIEAGLWFRLAELHVRRSKTARFFEMNRNNTSVVKFAPPAVSDMSSKKHISDGITVYERIQNQFPHFRDMDFVLFNNAFAKQQIGKLEQAKLVYRDMLDKHPNSQLIPDANLALGEMLYDERKFAQSLEYFGAIRKYPDALVYPYGLYKSAWAYYNIQNTAQALVNLEEVVAFGNKQSEGTSSHKLDLRKEALGDMVLFYSELHSSSKAVSYFSQHANKEEMGILLLKLANLYEHHGRHADLQVVLNSFVDKYQMAKERSKAHFTLINNFEILRQRSQSVKEMKRLQEICQANSSWYRENMSSILKAQEHNLDCHKLLTNVSSTLATKWHKAWLKNKSDTTLGDASESSYEIYLSVVKTSAQALKLNTDKELDSNYHKALYSLADLQFQREKFREASDKYFVVARHTKDLKNNHDATYSALVSLERAVKNQWDSNDEARFREIAKYYLELHPKGKYANEIFFSLGFIPYEKGRLKEAAIVFETLSKSQPVDEKVLKAQDLFLDILNTEKNFSRIKAASLEMSKTANAARKSALTKIYQESYFSEIQGIEESGNLSDAAENYRKFVQENPSSTLSDKAMWNGIQLEFKIGNIVNAAIQSFEFYKKFPKSANVKEALKRSAQSFEFVGRLKEAAEVLLVLSSVDPGERDKWLNISSDFFLLERDFVRARQGYTQLLVSKDEGVAANSVMKLVSMEKQSGNTSALQKLYEIVREKRYEPIYGDFVSGSVKKQFESGNLKGAFESAMTVLSSKGHSKRTLATVRFVQAQVLEREFQNQSIVSSPERLALVMRIKAERLEKAQSAYRDVIRFGDNELAVHSFRNLAFLYDHFVNSIRNLRFSKTVSEDELAMVREELEKVSQPIEDKAVETMTQAIALAKRAELRDGTIAELQNQLLRLNLKPELPLRDLQIVPKMMLPLIVGADPSGGRT